MTYALGIDLGTTFTAAAIGRQGKAEVVALGYRATSVPSVVFLTEEGRFLVGDAAERRAGTEPDRVAREFKRRVGDPTPLLLGGSPVAVDRCLAEMLTWVTATVSEAEGGPPAAVTVTHPANWGEFKRDVLREALRLADIPNARLLAEPLAAAVWYAQAQRLAPGQTVAVYDLGGGTFDAAVLRRRADGQFETLGRSEGIERLGGVDIDQAVLGHVLRALGGGRVPGSLVDADPDDPATVVAMAQLREACVEAKEALSSETSVTIPVWLPGLHHQVLLHRTELEELVGPLLRPTVDALARVVASAGLRPSDLHAVLLVGGSSRIPLIGRQVSAGLGRPLAVDAHPKHPVALGAALDAIAHLSAPAAAAPTAVPPRAVPAGVGPASTPWPPAAPPSGGWAAAGAGPAPAPAPAASSGPFNLASRPPPPLHPPGPLRAPPPRIGPSPEGLDSFGRRSLVLAAMVTPLVMVLVIVFVVLQGRGDPGDDADETVTGTDGTVASGDGGLTTVGGDDAEAPAEPVGPVNLMLDDAAPALEAFAGIYGEGTTPRAQSITIYDEYAFAEVQVPDQPTYVDSYQWEDGQLSPPEPALIPADPLEPALFDVTEVDPAVIPVVAQQTLPYCTDGELEISHISIERDLVFDDGQDRVLISVYASHPVRTGGGGYVKYTTDGAFVDDYCD